MIRIAHDNQVFSMDRKHPPCAEAHPGDMVCFVVTDAFGGQVTSPEQTLDRLDWARVNPATGPLFIHGAEPGDTLKVEIIKIDTAEQGVMAAIPGAGLFAEVVTTPEVKIISFRDGKALFSAKIELPLKPMIGVIGVAPRGEGIPCGVPGTHGGNMDNARITAGTTLYLPVFVPGALLAMGDLHAVMGDGEVMVTGVECSGEITVRVVVEKGRTITNPQHEDDTYYYTIASDLDLLAATKQAALDMCHLVMKRRGLSFNEAGMLISAAGHAQICQVVDPKLTARFALPKHLLGM